MKNLEEILLLGDINIDTIWPVAEFPVPGRDGLAPTVEVEIGGAVVNSALVLDSLGLRVSLIGSTGQDVWAQYVIQKLSDTDIGLSRVHDKPGVYTGLTFIIVTPDGERTMFSHRGANINLEVQDIDKDAFEHACMLHISGYALMESPQRDAVWRAVELAKEKNIHISLDTGLEPAIQRPEELNRLLPDISVCVIGLQEASALLNCETSEDAVNTLLSYGIQLVGIKLGDQGCIMADESHRCSFPIFPVEVIDTTGAGDSFTAGMLFGWTRKLSLQATGTLASALGALAATVYGGGLALPHKQQLLDFLYSMQGDPATVAFREGLKEVIDALETS